MTPQVAGRRTTFTLLWLVVVGALTLTGAPDQAMRAASTSWNCLACGDAGGTDLLLNLLLFLPLGIFARAANWPLKRTALLLFLLTVGIEATQATLLTGRDASLGDVLANTAGGIGGWLFLPMFASALKPTLRFALRAAVATLIATSLIWWLTGTGLQVAFSPAAPWVGQPLHRWPLHEPFRGTLQQVTIAGITIPNDPLPALPAHNALDLTIAVTRRDTIAARLPVSILRIVDANGQLQLSVNGRGGALQLEHRVRASNWLLRTPTWEFAGAFTTSANTPWRWRWIRLPDAITLQSGPVDRPAVEQTVPVSLGLGWAFIHPFAPAVGASAIWWSTLWIGWWLGLLGWFAGWLGTRSAVGFGAAGVVSMLLASTLTGVTVLPSELCIAALAYLVFALLALQRRKQLAD